ncbi:hypothetical protein Nm8I071_56540 [Nonomuraea sp. TT08I-71]|nr:hypothetical protein Nm8I071_56540 [Nonomuraea sp. TT08I-71]
MPRSYHSADHTPAPRPLGTIAAELGAAAGRLAGRRALAGEAGVPAYRSPTRYVTRFGSALSCRSVNLMVGSASSSTSSWVVPAYGSRRRKVARLARRYDKQLRW